MRRFLVFRNEQYYPCFGLDDLEKTFDTLEEAHQWITQNPPGRSQSMEIVDQEDIKQ